MSEQDFLSRRRQQLAAGGRGDLAKKLVPAAETDELAKSTIPTAITFDDIEPILRQVAPERVDTAIQFINRYADIIQQLTALHRAGYRTSREAAANHEQMLTNWTDQELYQAVMTLRTADIQQRPAHYSQLVAQIQRRDPTKVILSGIFAER